VREIGLKILIAGLDEAGKTSILNVLNENYNLMDRIKPTVGYQLTSMKILGVPVVTYDLGGQAAFRNNYFKDTRIFVETDSLFFVIDAFQVSRFNEAFDYYKRILETYKHLDLKPKIVLCIHKVDPNLRDDPRVPELAAKLRERIVSMSAGFEVTSFTTSIYDRKTIAEAFSKTLQDLIIILKPFKRVLEAVVRFLKLEGALLFDENFLIIGDHFLNPELEQKCLDILYNSLSAIRNDLKNVNPNQTENIFVRTEFILDSRSENQEKSFTFIEIKYKALSLYLLTMGREKVDREALEAKFMSMCELFETVDYLK
jgi:GTPase SAR1 family protein